MLDGVYASAAPCKRPVFHPAEAPSDADVAEVVAPRGFADDLEQCLKAR